MKRRFVFLKNAAILTVSSLALRTIGMVFRVYLSNAIGAEGMGLYQLVFSIYVLASTFATSGISTGVTKLVAEDAGCGSRRSIGRILRRAVVLSALIGVASALIVALGAGPIAQYALQDDRAVLSLRILSVSLPFMGVSSCLKGYFIARRKIGKNTSSQILEQLVRIGIIMLIIGRFAPMGIAYACAAVMIGDTVAEMVSCLHMGLEYLLDRRKLPDTNSIHARPIGGGPRILRRLLGVAVPITAGRYLNTALRTVENLLVPSCLTRFSGSRERGLSEFGMLKGMAMPILFFPSSFLSAFSTLLVPELSEATVLGQSRQVERAVKQCLRVTLLISLPIAAVFALFSKELGVLIYNSEEVGFLIGVLAPIMPFMYLESVVDGMLKGLGQQVSSLRYSVLDSVIRIAAIFLLVPARGMQGFLFVMIVSNILTSFLNIRRLLVVTGVRIQWGQWIFKPLLAIGLGAAAAHFGGLALAAAAALPLLAQVVLPALAAVVIYAALLLLLGCVTREDLRWVGGKPRSAPSKP